MARKRRRSYEYRDKLPWGRTIVLTLITLVALAGIIAFCRQQIMARGVKSVPGNITAEALMEVEGAPALGSNLPVDYKYMKIGFNPELHIPNWVAWELTRDHLYGHAKRGKFLPDPDVEGCVDSRAYTGSGFDRGHMCPAADNKWNEEAMRECFLMTNICPQDRRFNGGIWKKLEDYSRSWADVDSAIIIICGPIYDPEPDEFIGREEVAVPKRFFKVFCSPWANPPRALGYIMNNGDNPQGFRHTACSVDDVEAATGYDFFAALPDSIENEIETQAFPHQWRISRDDD